MTTVSKPAPAYSQGKPIPYILDKSQDYTPHWDQLHLPTLGNTNGTTDMEMAEEAFIQFDSTDESSYLAGQVRSGGDWLGFWEASYNWFIFRDNELQLTLLTYQYEYAFIKAAYKPYTPRIRAFPFRPPSSRFDHFSTREVSVAKPSRFIDVALALRSSFSISIRAGDASHIRYDALATCNKGQFIFIYVIT